MANDSLTPDDPAAYHITDIENLPAIIQTGALYSDGYLARNGHEPTVVGYSHIKQRRLEVCRVSCAQGQAFVGEFVPFYYCPRSVMLYTINKGNTGRPEGCQETILHLATRTSALMKLGREWAISDGNASAAHALFYNSKAGFKQLNWAAIKATSWSGQQHQKAAEFLVRDLVPWEAFVGIGCRSKSIASRVREIIDVGRHSHRPEVKVIPSWYY